MATLITHVFVGAAAGKIYAAKKMDAKFLFCSMLAAALPDIDAFTFFFETNYMGPFSHRMLFHSLLFALALSFVITWFAFKDVGRFKAKWWALWAFFFVVATSHGILDAVMEGGVYGVGFFVPFVNERYFLPWTFLKPPPIGMAFFSVEGVTVLLYEMLYVWAPLVAILGCRYVFSSRKKIIK